MPSSNHEVSKALSPWFFHVSAWFAHELSTNPSFQPTQASTVGRRKARFSLCIVADWLGAFVLSGIISTHGFSRKSAALPPSPWHHQRFLGGDGLIHCNQRFACGIEAAAHPPVEPPPAMREKAQPEPVRIQEIPCVNSLDGSEQGCHHTRKRDGRPAKSCKLWGTWHRQSAPSDYD